MANYTKGEWKADGSGVVVDTNWNGKVIPSLVAQAFDPENHQTINETTLANAYLIAASPNTYERLKATTDLLKSILEEYSLLAIRVPLQDAITDNLEALAKAEGK